MLQIYPTPEPPIMLDCKGCTQLVDSSMLHYVDMSGAVYCPQCRALMELSSATKKSRRVLRTIH